MHKIYRSTITKSKHVLFLILACLSHIATAHFGSGGPFGGQVTVAIAKDTSNVYIGTAQGGVFESTDNNLNAWRARPVGLKSGKISALAHSGKYLFAGTADSGIFIFTGYSGATDRYWIKKNRGLGDLKITSLLALDSITLLAGTKDGGIFRTTDKGEHWVAVNSTAMSLQITGLVKAKDMLFHSSSGGVYASADNGMTWTTFNDVHTQAGITGISFDSTSVQLLVTRGSEVYSTHLLSTSPSPLYQPVSTGLPAGISIRSVRTNGINWFLATDNGVWISPVGSISWSALNGNLPSVNVIAVTPFRNFLVAGTAADGIWKTTAPYSTWLANNRNFNALATYSLVVKGPRLIVTSTEKGVFVSRDLAANYRPANSGLTDSLHVTDLVFAGNSLFASTQNKGVFASEDTGRSWVAFSNELPLKAITRLFYTDNKLYAIASGGSIYAAFPTSNKWSLVFGVNQLTTTAVTSFNDKLVVASSENGVSMLKRGEQNWSQTNIGLTNLHVTSLVMAKGKLFAGTAGSGVFVTDTATISWQPAAPTSISHTTMIGLNGNYIEALAANEGYVYASYQGGLLATSDNGMSWIAGGNQFNLPSYAHVQRIAFSEKSTTGSTTVSGRVFVTTSDNSLYSNALSELPALGLFSGSASANDAFVSLSPNPASQHLTVLADYSLGAVVDIAIFNATGKRMNLAGTSETQLLLSYPKGWYVVQVKTAKGTISKKLVIE